MDRPTCNPDEGTTPPLSNLPEPVSESAVASLLKRAVEEGCLAEIPWLRPEQLLLVDGKDSWTPLHLAAKYGHLREIAPMLTLESLSTGDSQYGVTPIRLAQENGHLEQLYALFPPAMVEDIKRRLDQGLL